MPRSKRGNQSQFDNCFGFNESDSDLSVWERSSVMNDTSVPVEFQPNKPYRLALYVRPIEQKRRLQRTKASMLVRNTSENQVKCKKPESVSSTKLSEKKEPKKRGGGNKNLNISLFDENVEPVNVSKKFKCTPEKTKLDKNTTVPISSTKKNVLKEINKKSLPKTKQSKIRRSYERKFKEKEETENIPEPPSEEIIRELECKKLSQNRTKQKKTAKEEQEFEKWANNMNCAFDDVDKFELSIAYD